ncbi:Proton-coupled amino acid transporter 4 [Seminavis robusta]|uniref:Proton-coupled amino acid transporter 4 n=1 Tax=Seminavis robusta TaxID=568900 RepID=A0A9N8HH00_9STRA|nr:Proton-coupled amino acid transporter 4 [Seminavis robusta]|eukprot:Sro511_g157480.1 Proton-coupled amino acid transporter 4 (506) ;mRNA; f:43704-45221
MMTHRTPSDKEQPSTLMSAMSTSTSPTRSNGETSHGVDANVDVDESSDYGIELKPLVHGLDGESSTCATGVEMGLDGSGSGSACTSSPRRRSCNATSSANGGITTGSHASATAAVGTASNAQVAVNIFISFVGAGLLGQPFAFSKAGWLLGTIAVIAVSAANVYAMLLLVQIRKYLEHQDQFLKGTIKGYGCIGRVVSGTTGENFVNICLVISQVGFATAYIIFIAANITTVFPAIHRSYICFGCVPILCILVQVQDMKTLSPFSLIADVANILGLSAVLFQDYEYYEYHHEVIHAATNFKGFIYVASVAIYSLEGVNLVLPLESSCADRKGFPKLLMQVITGISILMVAFGSAGYIAFGSKTEAPVTLNLPPDGPWGNFVKVALSLALYLTYPVMMFPVGHVLEDQLQLFRQYSVTTRALVVFLTSVVAWAIPSFGKFLGLVGSSICMILGFILPCYFHLRVFDPNDLSKTELFMDYALIVVGTIMGVIGTYNSFMDLLEGNDV